MKNISTQLFVAKVNYPAYFNHTDTQESSKETSVVLKIYLFIYLENIYGRFLTFSDCRPLTKNKNPIHTD